MNAPESPDRGEAVIYETQDGQIELNVRLEQESLWLSLNQIATLFDRDKSVVSRHLRNIFEEGELSREASVAKNATVQQEGDRQVTRKVEFYNLDAILSVGYRVNTKRGTQFRIWATRVLRDHVIQGYSVNQTRLRDLNRAVRLIADTAARRDLSGDEALALLSVVGEYNQALELLDDYDHQRVSPAQTQRQLVHVLGYEESLRIVDRLRAQFAESDVFGIEKDKGLDSALGAIMQTVGGKEVYPSLEEKAAHLLYFLVKNHAFVDGNKRIAAALFLWFLERNDALRRRDGLPTISNATLVAMTLMIAESRPHEKDVLVRIVTHLLCNEAAD